MPVLDGIMAEWSKAPQYRYTRGTLTVSIHSMSPKHDDDRIKAGYRPKQALIL